MPSIDPSQQRRLRYLASLDENLIDTTVLSRDAKLDPDEARRAGRKVETFAGLHPASGKGTLSERREGGKVVDRYVHANITVSVWDGFRDVSTLYKIRRIRRNWEAELDPQTGGITKDFKREPGAKALYGFDDDCGFDSPWTDCPGKTVGLTGVLARRYVEEFVVGVAEVVRYPELVRGFGGLYFVVMVELTPQKYRVWMSMEKHIPEDDLRAAMDVLPHGPYPVGTLGDGGAPPDPARFRWFAHESWQPFA